MSWAFDAEAFSRAIGGKIALAGTTRAAAVEARVSVAVLTRAAGGEQVTVRHTITLCEWLGLPPDSFVTRPLTAKPSRKRIARDPVQEHVWVEPSFTARLPAFAPPSMETMREIANALNPGSFPYVDEPAEELATPSEVAAIVEAQQ